MPGDTPASTIDRRDQKRYYFDYTTFRRVLTPTVSTLFRAFSVLHARGVHHLPAQGAVVLAANHVTNFDVFPMQFVLPRPIFFMAKAELHENPLMDAMLRRLGTFPVQRGVRDDWSFQHALRVLKHGQVLGIFPEGKRNHGAGLRPAKTGAARLAITAGCPVVPLAVDGTQQMFKAFPRRTHIYITLGEPIHPQRGDTSLALTDRIMFALAEMLPPEQRGVYSEHPDWV
jgi:1-acyl-sn-glycerol-3-phosphate acyltransferase